MARVKGPSFFTVTVTMRLSLFLLNEHDDDDDVGFHYSSTRAVLTGNGNRSPVNSGR